MSDPELKKRLAEAKNKQSEDAAVTDASFPAPPASGANPTHREDFNSLLNAAAQKREPKD
jgi:hypothetical protein